MKAIEYATEQELDAEDAAKLQAYQQNVSNAEGFQRFSNKVEKDGKWYMGYNEELSGYFTTKEIDRVVDISASLDVPAE